jgi:hypothetical protein
MSGIEKEIGEKNKTIQKSAAQVTELEKHHKDATHARGKMVADIVDSYKEIRAKAPARVTNPLNGKNVDLQADVNIKVIPGVEAKVSVGLPSIGDRYDVFQGLTKGDALKKALPNMQICGLTGDKEALVVRKEGQVQILKQDGTLSTSAYAVLKNGAVVDARHIPHGTGGDMLPRCYFEDKKEAEKYVQSLKTEAKKNEKQEKEVPPQNSGPAKAGEAGVNSWTTQDITIAGKTMPAVITLTGAENRVFTKTDLVAGNNTYSSGTDIYRVEMGPNSLSYTKIKTGEIDKGQVTYNDVEKEEQTTTSIRPDGATISLTNEKITGLRTANGKASFAMKWDDQELQSLQLTRNGQADWTLTEPSLRTIMTPEGEKRLNSLKAPDGTRYAIEIDQNKIILWEIGFKKGPKSKTVYTSQGTSEYVDLEKETRPPTISGVLDNGRTA